MIRNILYDSVRQYRRNILLKLRYASNRCVRVPTHSGFNQDFDEDTYWLIDDYENAPACIPWSHATREREQYSIETPTANLSRSRL